MPEYALAALCLIILYATGVLKTPFDTLGLNGFKLCYVIAAALILSLFQLELSVELSFNLGAVAMLILPQMIMERGKRGGGGVLAALTLFSVVTALLCSLDILRGSSHIVLKAMLAGSSAMLLYEHPADAMLTTCAIPPVSVVAESFLTLINVGYAAIEIGGEVIAAQIIALSIAAVTIWISGATAEAARAGR